VIPAKLERLSGGVEIVEMEVSQVRKAGLSPLFMLPLTTKEY
jgi:hypothetical protein